jgi:hypothetical protein
MMLSAPPAESMILSALPWMLVAPLKRLEGCINRRCRFFCCSF